METRAVFVDVDGNRHPYGEIVFEAFDETPASYTRSMRTFQRYPIKWRVEVPGAKIKIVISATMPTQEFQTIIAFPAFWEWRCDVVGTRKGRKVTGLCFVERHGWEEVGDVKGFFKQVGLETRRAFQVRSFYLPLLFVRILLTI